MYKTFIIISFIPAVVSTGQVVTSTIVKSDGIDEPPLNDEVP